jgi:hypothetical protein
MAHMIPALALVSCAPDHSPDCVPSGPHLLLTTTDFEVGALSALDATGACVGDGLASVGPDSLARTVGDRVVTAQRTGGDAVRVYTAPAAEFVVEAEGNVHDVARVGDTLWFTLFDTNRLAATTLDGSPVAEVDLTPYADADGFAEPDLTVVLGDRLYVALQRLDRTGGNVWGAGPGGLVLEVDAASGDVLATFDVGSNPRLYAHPTDDDALVVLTGVFFALDGAVTVLHPSDGRVDEVLTEVEAGVDLNVFAGGVILGTTPDQGGSATIGCVSLADGSWTIGTQTDAWPVAAVERPDRSVDVAIRTGWSGGGDGAVWRVDPAAGCRVEPVAEGFRLDPFDVAWVP